MVHEEEVKYVNEILKYEEKANEEYNQLNALKQERYASKPNPPTKQTAQAPQYPVVTSTLKYDWMKRVLVPILIGIGTAIIGNAMAAIPVSSIFILGMIIGFVGFLGFGCIALYGVICYFTKFKKEQQADIERIKNTQEYKNQCAAIDRQHAEQQANLDADYNAKLNEYQNKILPEYNKALEAWTASQNEKISAVETEYRESVRHLTELYDTSKLFPKQYRKIPILRYIADVMNTSDYDVKTAIEMYDRNEQRKLDQARLYEQQIANQHAMDQNQLLQEQNDIAAKARRDANIAAVVGAVQHHNTNKTLKNAFNKK